MYKCLEKGDLEALCSLDQFSKKIEELVNISEIQKSFNLSDDHKNNIVFLSSGGGRAEVYMIEKLYSLNYKIGKVIFVDRIYEEKDSNEYKKLVMVLDGLVKCKVIDEYELLSSYEKFHELIEKSREKALQSLDSNLSIEDKRKLGINLIVGIHYQTFHTLLERDKFLETIKKIKNTFEIMKEIGIPMNVKLHQFFCDGTNIVHYVKFLQDKSANYLYGGNKPNNNFKYMYEFYKKNYLKLKNDLLNNINSNI